MILRWLLNCNARQEGGPGPLVGTQPILCWLGAFCLLGQGGLGGLMLPQEILAGPLPFTPLLPARVFGINMYP